MYWILINASPSLSSLLSLSLSFFLSPCPPPLGLIMCSGVRCCCCFAMWQQHFGPSPNCAVRARLQRHLPYPIAFHSLSLSLPPPSLFVCVCVFAFGLAKCANGMTPISIWCSPLFRVHQLQLLLTHLSCLSAARTAPAVCVCICVSACLGKSNASTFLLLARPHQTRRQIGWQFK